MRKEIAVNKQNKKIEIIYFLMDSNERPTKMSTPKPVTPTKDDIERIMNAQALSSLKSVWRSALIQLNVMSEGSDDAKVRETASSLGVEMRKAAKPGESHHRFAEFLKLYCWLLDLDIERVSSEMSTSHDEMMMAENEISALEALREAAEAWAEVYAARYPTNDETVPLEL